MQVFTPENGGKHDQKEEQKCVYKVVATIKIPNLASVCAGETIAILEHQMIFERCDFPLLKHIDNSSIWRN